jgi:hypothetical protein
LRVSAVIVWVNNDGAYIDTIYDSNQNPKTFEEAQTCPDFSIGGKLCALSLGTWNISKFGKSLQTQVYQQEGRS